VLADADTRASLLGSSMTAGWDRGFFLQSADGNYRLNIGGWIQPRYEYRFNSDAADTSSFLMRRVRLDFQGHIITPELTFRIMSEHARTSNLRDAWINYAFDRHLQVRFGQFTVPFQWHRDVGPRRQHFAERGVPSETFGIPAGRDLGIMAHGMGEDRRWKYGVGFFGGEGRNVAATSSDGHMVSGRFTYAVLGEVPREESDLAGLEEPNLSFAAGLQGAWRNEARAWDLGRSATGNEQADWVTGTIGAHFAWKGFSLAADGYLRYVDPNDPTVDSYDGWAWMVSAGYFIMPEKYELVGRYSELRLDSDDADTREREWGVGLNIYHAGHDWKTRVNLLRHEFSDRSETVFLIEHHLQF
jgi:phosphate-selective porin OprO and OprP